MSSSGHVQGQFNDDNGYLQFQVKCFGPDDKKKYYVLDGFGSAYMPPINTRALVTGSANKDENFVIGVLNKIDISILSNGESMIFSTNEEGTEIVSQIIHRNTGDIEINKNISGNATILIKADGAIELNGNADFLAGFTDLKSGFDTLKDDVNNLITAYNAHIHITTATVGATPAPGVIAPTTSAGTPSTASIDASKKENLKTE